MDRLKALEREIAAFGFAVDDLRRTRLAEAARTAAEREKARPRTPDEIRQSPEYKAVMALTPLGQSVLDAAKPATFAKSDPAKRHELAFAAQRLCRTEQGRKLLLREFNTTDALQIQASDRDE